MARVLVFAGSARRESLNKKLARVAADALRATGAEVTLLDLDEYPIPVYHGDLEAEQGMPENARKLREIFMAHDALLVASPENNASVSSLLKNTLDWLSRSIGDGKGQNSGLAPFRGKVAGMMTATPGAYGGIRGLPHLRQIFGALGVLVLPNQVQLSRADHAFDATGKLTDAKMVDALQKMVEALTTTADKLR
ncbi:MAG TPA: NAD(P)H-dependent oxidoreductase [Usitatibacter sp.]|nr:NAD(P)H-dependent oxidoreductase [Usitatibacter sp.]